MTPKTSFAFALSSLGSHSESQDRSVSFFMQDLTAIKIVTCSRSARLDEWILSDSESFFSVVECEW